MTGTIINIIAVVLGSALGVAFGGRLPERLHQTVVWGLGLFVLGLGVQMFLKTQNSLIAAGSLLVGALLGEWWQIEEGLKKFGAWLEQRFNRGRAGDAARFVRGFLAASLVFCVGPLAILGSIQDGLTGNFQTLAVKSVLDAFASLAFASSLGIGVAFSAVPLLIYQGGISLLAAQVQLALILGIGLAGLAANSACLFLLWRHRHEDINMSSVWECSRNDIASNLSVLIAAGAVWATGTPWPDLAIGALLAAFFLRSIVGNPPH